MKDILLNPFLFYRIKCRKSLLSLYVLPVTFSIALIFVAWFFPLKLKIFGETGLIYRLSEYYQILPGFYIAALAAVTAFNRSAMDTLVESSPEKCPKILFPNDKKPTQLTLRRYLCLTLSYLSALSLTMSFVFVFLTSLSDTTFINKQTACYNSLRIVFLFLTSSASFQVLFVTLYSLYLLSIKSNMPSFSPVNRDEDIHQIKLHVAELVKIQKTDKKKEEPDKSSRTERAEIGQQNQRKARKPRGG